MARIFLANCDAFLPRRLLVRIKWASLYLRLACAASRERIDRWYSIGVQSVYLLVDVLQELYGKHQNKSVSNRNAYAELYNYDRMFRIILSTFLTGAKLYVKL